MGTRTRDQQGTNHLRCSRAVLFKLLEVADFTGGPDRTRTCDLRFRKPLLYPAELRDHQGFFCSRAAFATILLPNGLAAYRAGEGRVNAGNGILLHSRDHVAVGVER
jgi:hypothetical protein